MVFVFVSRSRRVLIRFRQSQISLQFIVDRMTGIHNFMKHCICYIELLDVRHARGIL